MSQVNEDYKQLLRTSSKLWQLVHFKEQYGKSFLIMGKEGPRPYEEVLQEALTELEAALVVSGGNIHIPIELEHYLRRQVEAVHLN